MAGHLLLQDFTVVLLIAAIMGWVLRRLGLSVVVGYLLAGMVIGPYTPPFALVTEVDRIETLSQLGLVFLMFFVGMQLSLRKIRRLGFSVLLATATGAVIIFNLLTLFAAAMGWTTNQGLFLAAMFMVSSSAIISKTLTEGGWTHEKFAQHAMGVTVLEDVVAVVMLAILTSRVNIGASAEEGVVKTVWLLGGFTVLLVVLGLLLVPKILRKVGTESDSDLKAVLVAGLLLGTALVATNAGYSVALGSFLFGVVVSETKFRASIEKTFAGTQEMFGAIFFVSIGMMINIREVWTHLPLILGLALFALLARVLAASIALLVTGSALTQAVRAAMTLTPIGEFSYIIAQMGVQGKAVPDYFYVMAVGVSISSAVTAPLLIRYSEPFADWLQGRQPAWLLRGLGSYRDWLNSLGEQQKKSSLWKITGGRLGQLAVELLLIAGLLGFSESLNDAVKDWMADAKVNLPFHGLIFWSVMGLALLGLLVAAWRQMAALSMIYVDFLVKKSQAERMKPVLEGALYVFSAAGLGLMVVILSPIRSTRPVTNLVLAVILLGALALFWRRLIRWHSQMEISLNTVLASGGSSANKVRQVTALQEETDWEVELAECVLPAEAACGGMTLAQLNLRAKHGCVVVEVERQGMPIESPGADLMLFPEDKLLLFGPEEKIRKARKYLSRTKSKNAKEDEFDETVLETIQVPEGSPHVGQLLAELKIFSKTGVQVLGIERGERKILNPAGTESLEAGDRLLIMATPNEENRFRKWLEKE